MDDDGTPGPTLAVLRATSASLAIEQLGDQFRQRLEMAAKLERYYQSAKAVSVPRSIAHELLQRAQGDHAGSTPTSADLEAARELVLQHALSGPVPMTDQLRETVQHLAATTVYSPAELTAAVETLRGLRDPWPDDRISGVLPQVVELAGHSTFPLPEIARDIRQVCT